MPDVWQKRKGFTGDSMWSEIWDHYLGWWQINKAKRPHDPGKPYILLDGLMPSSVPASPHEGVFAMLEQAQEAADGLGKPDWSDWIEVYGDD